jgi:hypothetical protein
MRCPHDQLHPRTDGQTEIHNGYIKQMLRACVSDDKNFWASWPDMLMFPYDLAQNSTAGYSPQFLAYGYCSKQRPAFLKKRESHQNELITLLKTLKYTDNLPETPSP